MTGLAELFSTLDFGKSLVQELTDSEGERFKNAYAFFKGFVNDIKQQLPNPANYESELMNWQNSGHLSNYYWARIVHRDFKESSPCISVTANIEGLWISLMWHMKKKESSKISLEGYNAIVRHLESWKAERDIGKGDYQLYVKKPDGKKPNSKDAAENPVDVDDYCKEEAVRHALAEELQAAPDAYYVIRKLYGQQAAGFAETDKQFELARVVGDIEWLYERICVPDDLPQLDGHNAWWINAKPSIWNLDSLGLGQTVDYTTLNDEGNQRRIYKYFSQLRPGDKVIGYSSAPKKKVTALLEVVKAVHFDSDGAEVVTFKKISEINPPLPIEDVLANKVLAGMEWAKNRQGSLFVLTNQEFSAIMGMVGQSKNEAAPQSEERMKSACITRYGKAEFLEDVFMSDEEYERLCSLLKRKKNIILQGPPGVGKTFLARRLAWSLIGEKESDRVKMVQFHQSFSYEDFVQGYRPTKDGAFELKDGAFFKFCKEADPTKDYYFIIDEINRGNISKILGELMMLIECDKRGNGYAMPLTYSLPQDEPFFVPENVFIIGMMNTADRSLAMLDYALRRRFGFFNVEPALDKDSFKAYLHSKGMSIDLVNQISATLGKVNAQIETDKNLGKGFKIGHSYLCGDPGGDVEGWLNDVIELELEPLFDEYWFDNEEQAKDMKKIISALAVG